MDAACYLLFFVKISKTLNPANGGRRNVQVKPVRLVNGFLVLRPSAAEV
jgi:hypothetical protein